MRTLIIAAALVATPAAAATDQFDLACQGKNRTSPSGTWRPIEKHYRVDLPAGRWCQDRCAGIDNLAEVERDKITFRHQPRKFATDGQVIEDVDRVSGAWKEKIIGSEPNGFYWETVGSCEVKAFSGFPDIETKF